MDSNRKRKRDKPLRVPDCYVEVAADGEIRQYRAISKRLKAQSEMLAACLDERWAGLPDESGKKILQLQLPPNIRRGAVAQLLVCMYKGKLPSKSINNAQRQTELLVAADYLQSPHCATLVLEQLIRLAPDFSCEVWREVQRVLRELVELPLGPCRRLEAACHTWLTTQLRDLDGVVVPHLLATQALTTQQEEERVAWRCNLLCQLSVTELLGVIQAAQPRCAYQTSVVTAITLWAGARSRRRRQQQQQQQGEEEDGMAGAGVSSEEALQLAGAVRLAGLPRSLLPCLQQLQWWSDVVSPGMLLEAQSLLLTAADSLLSLAPFTTPTPAADRHRGTGAVLGRVRGLAEARGLPPPLWGWFTPPTRHDPDSATSCLELTAPSSLLAAGLRDAVVGGNRAAWRHLGEVCWAGLLWRLGCRWVAFSAPLEGTPVAAAPAARRTRKQAARAGQGESSEPQAGSSSSSWEDWALDVSGLSEAEAQATLAAVAEDCWGLQLCVVYALPGMEPCQVQLLMDPPALVSAGARLAPGERRPHVYQRALVDPSRGTLMVQGGQALVVPEVVPLLEVVQQLTASHTPQEAAAAVPDSATEQAKPGLGGTMPGGLPTQDGAEAEGGGVDGEVPPPHLPAGSITLQLQLGPLH